MPRLCPETHIGLVRCYSLRGRDYILFLAYLEEFLHTYGSRIHEHGQPSLLANGEWCVVFDVSPETEELWFPKPRETHL